ncbi:MAG: POTRA domain-containing protein [Gammaproteobacteria bacterium]|nr:POTRA domain-containing protein [Gammaproteobacteria bacterium]
MQIVKTLTISLLIFFAFQCLAADRIDLVIDVQPKNLSEPIKQALDLYQHQAYVLSSNSHMNTAFQAGYQQIQQALKVQGYFQARVRGSIHHDETKHVWHIHYKVTTGRPLLIKNISIMAVGEGQHNAAIQNVIVNSLLKIGQTLNLNQYDQVKSTLQTTAIANGYFDANYVQHQIQIKVKSYSAAIDLKLNTGKQYHYGTIRFDQSTFSNEFLNRFLNFKSGQAYSQEQVDQLQSNLASSGYFDSIAIIPAPAKTTYTVPITIKLIPKPAQEYQIGAGYGTDTGVRGLLGWKLRYIGKTGDYITAQIQAARNYTNVTSSFVIPGANPVTDYSSINVGRSETTITAYTATDIIAGLDHFVQHGPWSTELGITQHFIQATEPANPIEPAQRYLLPEATLGYTQLVTKGYFKQGYWWSAQAQGGSRSLLSSTSFAQGTLRTLGSINLDSNDRIFVKAVVGATAVQDISNLSPIFRFYAGGVDTVRGYAYKSLGPEDSNGNLIGGRYIAAAQFTVERRVWNNWSGLVFYDMGNAFNTLQSINLQKGAGLGTSWRSPVGTINLYVAHPIQPVQGSWRFDIGIETLL